MGGKLRIYPIPQKDKKLWIKFSYAPDPVNPQVKDDTIYGVSNLSNVPFGNLNYSKVNEIGRQWVRQYALALSKELLGLVRSKFSSVPLPDGDLSLNGADLISQGR